MEPQHPVHEPWVELTEANDNITWEPSPNDSYTGSQGGPKNGPTYFLVLSHWCSFKQWLAELRVTVMRSEL